MKKTLNTVFPFACLTAAAIFFFNPNVQLFDLLPDLFGYILLVAGLRYLADLNDAVSEARARFTKMFYVEAAKFLVFLMAFGGLVSPQEQSTFVLLASLSFCVIELIILIPAVRSLFAGGIQLATKFGSDAIFASRQMPLPQEPAGGFRTPKARAAFEARVRRVKYANDHRRCALEKYQTLTLIFVALKPAMALLPEFSALSSTEYNEGLVDFYNFITLFRGFGFVLLLPLAIVWLVRTLRFLMALRRDTSFTDACLRHYRAEILPRTELFTRRAIYAALSTVGLGMVFSLDFYLEYYNVIPDVLCAVFVAVGICLMRKYIKSYRPVCVAAACYGAVSVITSALTVYFNQVYYFNAIYKNDAAYISYMLALVGTVAENLLFLWMLWMLIRAMSEMIERYSGFSVTSSSDPSSSERVKRLHIELKKTLYLFFGAAVAMAATGVAYEAFKPTVPYVWMIDFAVAILYIYLFYRSTWEIREQVEYKYMLT